MSNELVEVWSPVPGYEGTYDVSADGQIMRVRYGLGSTPGRILKPSVTNLGYHQVRLYSGTSNSGRWHKVHRLVAAAFIGACPEGFQVNHKDGDKANNGVANLEYVTAKENIRHAERNGLRPKAKGERHGRARLTEQDVRDIRRLAAAGVAQNDIARRFGISGTHAHRIVRHKKWAHVKETPA